MNRPARRHLSRRARLVCASSAAALVWSLASAAAALPTGEVVFDSTGGVTTFTPGAGTLDINQGGDRVVIDWTTFDIAAGETVTFNQADASWIAFNRVNPANFTTIDGNLNAVGQVWLFSPGGLLIGPNAQVNTGSFLGSTAQLLDADVADALTTGSVTLSPLAVANGADLTVSAGANITATDGFVVLLGETIVQNGTIVSDTDAVWFGVAQGGEITFTSDGPGSPPELANGTVAAVADQQPSFTQGATGSSDAATWFGISTPATTASGWSTTINLGGSVQATGVQPGGTQGVIILNGDGGAVDLANGILDTSTGTISASADVYIAVSDATLGDITGYFVDVAANAITVQGYVQSSFGDVTLQGGNSVNVLASGLIVGGDDVYLVASVGDVTVSGDVFGSTIDVGAYDLVTIDGLLDGQNIDIESTDGAVLVEATGYLHSSIGGSPGIVISAATDLTVEAGAQVLANDVIDLTSDGTMTLDGNFDGLEVLALSDGQMDIAGDLYGNAYVELETTTGDLLMHSGASVDTSGFGGATPVTLISGGDLSIADGATVDSYANMAIRADGGDLTIDGDIGAIRVDLDATGDFTVGSTGSFVVNQFNVEAAGDILIDGVIDAPTTLFATSFGGDLTIGANADLSSFSVGLTADDQLTTVAGSHIDGDGGVGVLSFTANGADGADSAMELSGDITGHNVQIVASAGSVTVHDGTITAANDVNTYIDGDFTTEAPSLIDATGDVSIDVPGDITIAGEIRGDTIDLDGAIIDTSAGDLAIDTSLTVNGGSVTLGHVTGNTVQIDVVAANLIEIVDMWSTPYSDITLQTTAAGSTISINSYVYANTLDANSAGDIYLGDDADVDLRTYVNTNNTSQSATFTAVGDLTIADGAQLDARGRIDLITTGAGGDISVDGFFRGTYITMDSAGALSLDADFTIYTLHGDAVGDIDVGAGATFPANAPSLYFQTTTGDVNFDADWGGRILHITSDAGLVTIGATADIEAGILAAGGVLQIDGYDGVTIENGASVVSQSDMQIFGSGANAVVTVDGDVHGYGTGSNNSFAVVVGSQGELEIGATGSVLSEETLIISGLGLTIDGQVQATDNLLLRAYTGGDIDIGATADLQGDFVDIQAEGDITIAGDIYGYEVSIIADGNVTQSAGTITVDDGGLYIYALYDVTTEAGALIQTTVDGGGAIIYLNAGDDLTVGGDIDGGYFVNLNSEANDNDSLVTISGSIYSTDFIIVYNQYGDIHLTGTAELFAGQPTVFGDPGIFIAAEGSILSDAGSYIHTYPGYTGGYVLIESNDVAGSIDLSGDISSGNVYISSNFGDVDVILRDGAITAEGLVTLYSSGDLTIMDGATIDAAYAALRLYGPDGGLIRIDGDISTSETIAIYNYVGDIEIGATATLHANTDASPDNGGPLGYQTDTIEIRGENITAEAGSQILVGDLTDPYRGTVSIISDDLDYDLPTTVTLDGYIKAEAIDVSVVDGSIAIDGDIYTTGDLAFDVSGTFTLGTDGYIYNAGYLHVIAEDGIVFDGVAFSYGIELTTTAPGADIAIGGDLYSAFDIDVNSTGDIALGAGGTLQADFLYSAGGAINLTADGAVSSGLGSRIIVGHVGATTGDVVITASGADGVTTSAIELNGYIYANGLGLIAPNGSIHLGAGGIYLTDDLDIDAAFDFLMDAGAVIDTAGAVSITAQGDLTANGDIYAGGNVSFYKYATYDGDLTVGGFVHSDGYVSIINAADGDVLLGGTIIADADAISSPGYIYVSSEGQVVATGGGLLQVGSGPYNTTGDVTINASGADSVDYSAIDLNIDIIADGLNLNTTGGSIHLAGGAIDVDSTLDLYSAYDITIDAPVIIDTAYDVYFEALGSLTVDGDVSGANLEFTAGADLTVGGTLTGDYVTLTAGADLNFSGDILANYGASLTSTGGDVYVDGFIEAYATSGTAILISAEGDLTIAAGGDLEGYGDVVLQTTGTGGVLEVSGDVLGDNVYLDADGGILVGATADIYAYDRLSLLSDDGAGGATVADIQIDGIMDGNGLSIINRNDGDVIFGATADVSSYYYDCYSCRIDPDSPTALLGADGDIYIYSANSVITVAGSSIDATAGLGADKGLITIVANGPDIGASITTAAIDLSGDINAYNVVLTANNGSIRQRDGTITFTEDFTANADVSFIQDGGGVIDGLVGSTYADVNVYANNNILLLGVIEGYYVELTTTGTVPGSEIQVAGEVYASDGITITNLDGDILVHSTGVIHTGTPFETSNPYIDLTANGVITTEAGSQIYTDAAYSSGSQITLQSTLASGLGIDLAGDITTAGYVDILTTIDADIQITGGTIQAGQDVNIDSQDQIDITGGSITAGDTVLIYGQADVLLGGDIYADYISATGASILRVEGALTALTDILISGQGVEIGAGAVINGNYSGLTDIGSAAVHISGASILTEAGSSITVGDGGPPVGTVVLQVASNFAGPGPAIDLSGDITAETLTVAPNVNNDIRIRDGDISVINNFDVYTYGYFIVDDPASIASEGNVVLNAGGGMIIDGDLTGDRIYLFGGGPNGLAVNGGLFAREDINLYGPSGDVVIGGDAILESDTDNLTSIGEYTGINITAGDQVIAEAGARLSVGPAGTPTGDVTITAYGIDSGGYSAIDLSADIDAQGLILDTTTGSIRLRDGDITLTDDFSADSPRGFIMNGPATLTTGGFVDISAAYQVAVGGTITSGEYINLASTGLVGGGMTVSGYLYADGAIAISSDDPTASIVLGGPTIIADADNSGADGQVNINSAGGVLAPGGGLIQVGDGSGAPTGNVNIIAGGADGANDAIDLAIDINAQYLDLDAADGSIHLAGGAIEVTGDLSIISGFDFQMDGPASIDSGGDVYISAADALVMNGAITAAGDIGLYAGGAGPILFVADPGDMVIGGSVAANGSVIMGNAGGDIYLAGTASVLANADDLGVGDEVYLYTDAQIVTAAGSTIAVGTGLIASGDVTLLADGIDNVDYAAIDLSGSIYAANLSLQTTNGSIAINDGAINGDLGITIDSAGAFTIEDGVYALTGGDFIANATGDVTLDGIVTAAGSILVTRSGAGAADIVISGELYAAADIDIINNGAGGDIVLNGAVVLADYDGTGPGSVQILSNGGVHAYNGGLIASGNVNDPTNLVSITANGGDNGALAAIDLDVDIAAGTLQLTAANGSIHLEGGSIVVLNPLTIDSGLDVLVAAGVDIDAGDDVSIFADRDLTMDGAIDSGGAVTLAVQTAAGGVLSVGGQVYADQDVTVLNYNGDIYLTGATLVADADGLGGDGDMLIDASGSLTIAGSSLIVGVDGVSATGSISLESGGALVVDADTWSTDLDIFSFDTVDLTGGQFTATGYVDIGALDEVFIREPASVTAGSDIFVQGGTLIDIAGDLTADGSVYVSAAYYGGDVYIGGSAAIQADADNSASGDLVHILADGQVVSAAGSSIIVGATGAPTGDVSITAAGGDAGGYSALDLASDIEAQTLSLNAGTGSINLAGGQINVTEDLSITSALDVIIDEPANIDGQGDIEITAGRVLTVEGSVQADGDLSLLLQGANAQDLTVDRLMSAGGAISIINDGSGDVILGSDTALFSGGDILVQANGDVSTDGFIDAGGLLTADAGGDLVFDADVQAGGGIILISGDNMAIGGYLIAEGYTDIFADAGGTLTQTGHLLNAGDIRLYSGDDMALDGPIDSQGLLYALSDADLSVAGTVQTGAIALVASGNIDLSGDLTAASADIDAQAGLGLTQSGSLAALGDIDLRSTADMDIDGSVTALDDIYLTLQGAGDIQISGDVIARDDVEIANFDGDVRLYSGGSLVADVDGNGGDDVTLSIYASDRIFAADGSTMHVGSATERTGVIDLYAMGYDGESGSAIELGGTIDAQAVVIEAYDGSVQVSGSIQADEFIEIVAYHNFILEDGGQLWGAMDRALQDDISDGPILPGLSPGVGIVAADVSIEGEIRSGTATDDATIVIAAHYVDGDVIVGGADAALGGDFNLSDAEFQNLYADRIVILAGEGDGIGSGYDLHIADLSIDAANTNEVWFGTSENLFVDGVVAPTQPGEVDLHLGLTVLVQDPDFLLPGEMLVGFIPDNVYISGSLGTVDNPFGSVTMIVQGDILMGTQAFMDAAASDPEFDAAEESENFVPPAEGHVFVATDQLQMAAGDRILQQDTDTGTGYGGLVLGLPQPGFELIFSPDQLQGLPIGGTNGWTADFDAGPTRIELFGSFNGSPQAIDGRDAANVANLLDPDILLGDFYFNTCLFSSNECSSSGDDVPPFIDPTPPVHPEPGDIPGIDDVLSFFTTFPFEEPDEEEDEDQVEGEPVTGSGNEDLWPIKPTQGIRP